MSILNMVILVERNSIVAQIMNCNKRICDKFNLLKNNEYKVDTNSIYSDILIYLRPLVESVISFLIRDKDELVKYEDIQFSINKLRQGNKHKSIVHFHSLLQASTSHYVLLDYSERLLLKYLKYLLDIKNIMNNEGYKILECLDNLQIQYDPDYEVYYKAIIKEIRRIKNNRSITPYHYKQRFYVLKSVPIFMYGRLYYELSVNIATDNQSKFTRMIVFSDIYIPSNYAVELHIYVTRITCFDSIMPIFIVKDYKISIRPCELRNYAKIFGIDVSIKREHKEYKVLMDFLQYYKTNFLEIINNQSLYNKLMYSLSEIDSKFKEVIQKSYNIIHNNQSGSNILRYLIFKMNNQVIKKQLCVQANSGLSNLFIDYGCIPFNQQPFCSSLKNHNPLLYDLLECIDTSDKEHEFLARCIRTNTEEYGHIFTHLNELQKYNNIDTLIARYNNFIYKPKHENRMIERFNNYLYIKEYIHNFNNVIKLINEKVRDTYNEHNTFFTNWIQNNNIDSGEKKKILENIFVTSRIGVIYGAAGTGKTTFITYLAEIYDEKDKIFIANTNTAVENLKRRIACNNSSFYTVATLKNKQHKCFLLVIDECSTISNSDILSLLSNIEYEVAIFVGDTFQIQSIRFGNWFKYLKEFIDNKLVIYELESQYRTNNKELKEFWDAVRNKPDKIKEFLAPRGYTEPLNLSIFDTIDDDQILLCFNYDGLYGINNINILLQSKNKNSKETSLGIYKFKVNDPVMFNDSSRFKSLIHNNTKGIIRDILENNDIVTFYVKIFLNIDTNNAKQYGVQVIEKQDDYTIISFEIEKNIDTDVEFDSDNKALIPFQLAYATSIHKAQGLEYSSVKIVVTDVIDEFITHDIFYTAVTRSKNKLKIYWSAQTEENILSSFVNHKKDDDKNILKGFFNKQNNSRTN